MLNLLAHYDNELADVEPERFPLDAVYPEPNEMLAHARWMAQEARSFDDQEKRMRWVGCIQGVLWAAGERTIDQLREETRRAKAGKL